MYAFQSLSWWNGDLQPCGGPRLKTIFPGFNPCHGGMGIYSIRCCEVGDEISQMFQSLSWWNGDLQLL